MIVICTKCQAKFRVADEKIGPRGAKVRCSRCQTIAIVHREAEAAPAPAPAEVPPPLPPPLGAPRRTMDVDLEHPPGAGPDDPFAAAGFGAQAGPAAARDPFAASSAPSDPFAPPAEADPFAAQAGPSAAAQAEASRLAVTDLSDLLGPPTSPEAPAPSEAGPSELGVPPVPPPEPGSTGGLSLEDRLTPPPIPARSPLEGGGTPSAQPGEPFGVDAQAFGSFELGAAEGGDLALATETPAPSEEPQPPAPFAEPAALELASPAPPAAAPRPIVAAVAPLAEERLRPPRPSRLHAVVVNAIALAALLLVAAAMLVVWREGSFDAASLRPAAILATLRGRSAGPFAALEVRSGWYDREKGPPLLFVRGRVASRAPAEVQGVTVKVEIVRGEVVVARGEALAGAVPTPEELHQAADAAAVAAVARAAAARAPGRIRPGDDVPFLVAIEEAPADLDGATVRVALAEAKGAAR